MQRKLNNIQEREVLLSYLCKVSPKYMASEYNIAYKTIGKNILGRSASWNDPLVEFYREANSERNGYRNAVHLFLAFNNQAEGLPHVDLVEKTRDIKVYNAVEGDIFEPKSNKLIGEDTHLAEILGLTEEEHPELALVNEIFGNACTQAKRLVMPLLYQQLREAYNSSRIRLEDAYHVVRQQILSRMWEMLYSTDNPFATEPTHFHQRLSMIGKVLDTISSREREILRWRYGLEDGKGYTLEEIGKKIKVSRDRVRQIQIKALNRLRHPVRIRILEEFLYGVKPVEYQDDRQRPVTDFELSTRARNALRALEVKTIGDLSNFSEREISSFQNVGPVTIEEIRSKLLEPYNLDFKPD